MAQVKNRTHCLVGFGARETRPSEFEAMHIKTFRRVLDTLGLPQELADNLPIHAMSIPEGHGWPWSWELWVIPISRDDYLAARRDGHCPSVPGAHIVRGIMRQRHE